MTIPIVKHAAAVRAVAWAFFVLLVALRVIVPAAVLSPRVALVLGDILIYLLPVFMATVSIVLLAGIAEGVERRFWGLLAVASGFVLMSETYFTWYSATIDPRGPPMPAPYELLQLVAAAAFFGVVVTMTTFGSAPRVARARFYVDVLAGAVVTHALIYWFLMRPLAATVPGADWRMAAVLAVYPIVGCLMLASVAVVDFGRGLRRLGGWELLVAGAIALFSLTLCTVPWSYVMSLTSSRSLQPVYVTVGLGFGYYLLFMATVYRWSAGASAAVLELWPVPKVHPGWLPAMYPVALAAVLPLLAFAALTVSHVPEGIPIEAASVALAVLLVVRSWLLGLERSYHRAAAITDPETGAFNHRHLHERLTTQISQASGSRRSLAVGVLDVDDFAVIQGMLGEVSGTTVLMGIARVLREELGPDNVLYRLGGGEFAFVAPDVDAAQATDMAQRALDRVGREVEFGTAAVSLSAGIATYPAHASDSEQIVARAIAAQQLARISDDTDVAVYDEALVGASDPQERLARARRRSHRATVQALASAVDARDPDTRHHSQNVADLATALALVLAMSPEQTHVIELAAQMHDVGKLGIGDEVLFKAEPLTPEEQAHVEEHPILGERILAAARLDDILPAVRSHHERWDGQGYPDGLMGFDIPLVARLLSVCDAFEAMTSVRRHQPTLTVPRAVAELERCSGTQFDPDIVLAFSRMVGRLHGQALRDTFSGQ